MDEKNLREACELVAGMTFGEWEVFSAIVDCRFDMERERAVERALAGTDLDGTRIDGGELFDHVMHGEASVSGT